MRKTIIGAAFAALTITSAPGEANAQSKRKTVSQKKTVKRDVWKDPALELGSAITGGGPTSCLDGRPCDDTPPPAPKPRSYAAPIAPSPRPTASPAVAYQADGYAVYLERPGYCTLYLDTPRGAMVRMSYGQDGATNFSYVRHGLALDANTPSYPALFGFDGSRTLASYAAIDTQLDDGRAGFMLANANDELLERWGNAQSVTIRLGSVSARPFDTISLSGSGAAIDALHSCAQPGFSNVITETVMPPPPDETGQESATPADRRFPNGERVTLSFEPMGMGGAGTITRRAPGQPTRSVTISYMSEFTAIIAADRIQYSVVGTTDQGQQSWSCEVSIDWRTGKVIAVRDLSRFDHPPCRSSL